eukprot:TRINITY_DN25816_c0_g1_i1.p1 TRINITY_DN25816_c0_g1~~TRINITY_DN25816_c0_g1_i1.p1  ORF type:complete len:546 (+),score=156.34 TRINITY_DN25816_c0_g1_i1:151-1788(+)
MEEWMALLGGEEEEAATGGAAAPAPKAAATAKKAAAKAKDSVELELIVDEAATPVATKPVARQSSSSRLAQALQSQGPAGSAPPRQAAALASAAARAGAAKGTTATAASKAGGKGGAGAAQASKATAGGAAASNAPAAKASSVAAVASKAPAAKGAGKKASAVPAEKPAASACACGAAYEEDAMFCKRCGKKRGQAATPKAATQTAGAKATTGAKKSAGKVAQAETGEEAWDEAWEEWDEDWEDWDESGTSAGSKKAKANGGASTTKGTANKASADAAGKTKSGSSTEATKGKKRSAAETEEAWDWDDDWQDDSAWDESASSTKAAKKEKDVSRAKKAKALAKDIMAVDAEGRRYDMTTVVVNFANVGASYGKTCLNRDSWGLFDWEGVRRAVRYLTSQRKMKVIGVINQDYRATDCNSREQRPMPRDIRQMCACIEEVPRVDGDNHKSIDDEVTILCAYRLNCHWVDNDNYKDWKQQMRDDMVREWLNTCQDFLRLPYFFSALTGTFDVLQGNIPSWVLAPDKGKKKAVDKYDLRWIDREKGGS